MTFWSYFGYALTVGLALLALFIGGFSLYLNKAGLGGKSDRDTACIFLFVGAVIMMLCIYFAPFRIVAS